MTIIARVLWTVILLLNLSLLDSRTCYANSSEGSVGVHTLGLLNPRFPVKDVFDTLKGGKHVSFAFVWKSFGGRKENLRNLLDLLAHRPYASSGSITVIVYIECGPCRSPRRPKGLFPVIQSSLSIQRLNRLLERSNTELLARLNKDLEEVRSLLPIMPGVEFIVHPGLEDNFTNRAHAVLRQLTLQVFRERNDVIVGRNALHFKQASYPVEAHSYSLSKLRQLKRGDVLAGDGSILCFPKERGCHGTSLNSARTLVKIARSRGIHLLFWRPEMQGLPLFTPGSKTVLTPPSKRKYRIAGKGYLYQLIRS